MHNARLTSGQTGAVFVIKCSAAKPQKLRRFGRLREAVCYVLADAYSFFTICCALDAASLVLANSSL